MIDSTHHLNVILLLGIAVFGGTIGARIFRRMPIPQIIGYILIGQDNRLLGAVTLRSVRNTFATQELNEWLVALDVMEPAVAQVTPETPLSDAFEKAKGYRLEYLPVVNSERDNVLAGLLDCQAVRRALSADVLSRQEKADSMRGT